MLPPRSSFSAASGESAGRILVIIETTAVFDEKSLQSYRIRAREQMLQHGGVLLAHGQETFHGAPFSSLTVQSWPSRAAFVNWQESEAYRPLKALRDASASVRIAILALM